MGSKSDDWLDDWDAAKPRAQRRTQESARRLTRTITLWTVGVLVLCGAVYAAFLFIQNMDFGGTRRIVPASVPRQAPKQEP